MTIVERTAEAGDDDEQSLIARIWHFAVMWAILFFLLGHLIMVILHGWNNFASMLTGWKKNPEYLER